jgi:hypothetical protein
MSDGLRFPICSLDGGGPPSSHSKPIGQIQTERKGFLFIVSVASRLHQWRTEGLTAGSGPSSTPPGWGPMLFEMR